MGTLLNLGELLLDVVIVNAQHRSSRHGRDVTERLDLGRIELSKREQLYHIRY